MLPEYTRATAPSTRGKSAGTGVSARLSQHTCIGVSPSASGPSALFGIQAAAAIQSRRLRAQNNGIRTLTVLGIASRVVSVLGANFGDVAGTMAPGDVKRRDPMYRGYAVAVGQRSSRRHRS